MELLRPLELEFTAAQNLIGRDRRANIFFDVLDDELCALKMADLWGHLRIVHGVREIADQDDVLAVLGHLPQAKRPAEDTHVGMNADENHVIDASFFKHVPDFNARIADGIFALDRESCVLALPRGLRIAAHRLELRVPFLVFLEIVVLAPVGLIDRILALLLGRDFGAPLVDVLGQFFRCGCRLSPFAAGMFLIRVHATRRGMNDERSLIASFLQELVHARDHFLLAAHSIQAVMRVPHVADDDGRLFRGPSFRLGRRLVLNSRTQRELEIRVGSQGGAGRDNDRSQRVKIVHDESPGG